MVCMFHFQLQVTTSATSFCALLNCTQQSQVRACLWSSQTGCKRKGGRMISVTQAILCKLQQLAPTTLTWQIFRSIFQQAYITKIYNMDGVTFPMKYMSNHKAYMQYNYGIFGINLLDLAPSASCIYTASHFGRFASNTAMVCLWLAKADQWTCLLPH